MTAISSKDRHAPVLSTIMDGLEYLAMEAIRNARPDVAEIILQAQYKLDDIHAAEVGYAGHAPQ